MPVSLCQPAWSKYRMPWVSHGDGKHAAADEPLRQPHQAAAVDELDRPWRPRTEQAGVVTRHAAHRRPLVVAVAMDAEHRAHHLGAQLLDQLGLEEAAEHQVAEAAEPVDLLVAGEPVEGVGRLVLPLGTGDQLGSELGMGVAQGAGRPVEQPPQFTVGRRAHDRGDDDMRDEPPAIDDAFLVGGTRIAAGGPRARAGPSVGSRIRRNQHRCTRAAYSRRRCRLGRYPLAEAL